MQTGESRQARHICAVCFVHPYVHYAHVRCNACNMHVYKSIYLYMHDVTHLRTHVQNGCTALWLACANKHEGAAAELMEATKRAGALDLQVPHEAGQGGCVV